MAEIAVNLIENPGGPNCSRCDGKTRLFGIEPHPTVEGAELRTYVCTQCDDVQAEVAALRSWTMPG